MDVIVIVFFHFYVLIRPEILLSGTRSTMRFAAYTTLLNMYYLVPNTYCESCYRKFAE